MESILNNFEYENKPWHLNAADKILSPVRDLFGGKTVQCIEKDNVYTFRVPNSKNQPTLLIKTITRIVDVALIIITFPLIALALASKAIDNEGQQKLLDRFVKVENFWKNEPSRTSIEEEPTDKIVEREILEDHWFFRLAGLIAKSMEYPELQQAAHILADKGMRGEWDSINEKYKDSGLGKYQGGLFFISGQMLSRELSKCTGDPTIGADVIEAKKKIDEYNHWCGRFLGIMPYRFVPMPGKDDFIKDLAIDLQNRIESLQPGESFLIPINIQPETEVGFHTITARFIRTDENSCEFKVYNVGYGSSHHTNCISSWRTAPFHIRSIPTENLTSVKNFLIPLINHATFEVRDEDCNNLYTFLKTSLQQIVGKDNFNIEVDKIDKTKMIQHSGTCIWKSPMAALKDCMPLGSYKRFVLKMKKDKWFELFKKYEDDSASSADKGDAEQLMKSAAGAFKKAIANKVMKNEFSEKELVTIERLNKNLLFN
ncbi:MAG TPA: hypothetical protein VIH61_09965 [Waddliaceae bacterium]